jgi:hypothetical protein
MSTEKEPCGFAGITEAECVQEFKCCYNQLSALPCFKSDYQFPKKNAKTGISETGAGILTAFFFLIVPIAWFFLVKRNSEIVTINNPTFTSESVVTSDT